MLAALAVVVAVAAWLTLGQGGGGGDKEKTAQPAPARSTSPSPGSITPGATPTGPAINSYPGGTSGGTGSGSGAADGGSGSGASGATSGGTGGGSAGGGSGSGSSTGGGTGGSGTGGDSGGAPPINTGGVLALPTCTASQLTLQLAGTQDAYQAAEKPTFELKIHNVSTTNCRVDLGQSAAAITVSSASGERIWSSGDCPTDKQSRWVQVSPANVLTETFVWDRSHSQPQCATPTDTSPAPVGKYSVQAELTGPSGGPVKALVSTRLDG